MTRRERVPCNYGGTRVYVCNFLLERHGCTLCENRDGTDGAHSCGGWGRFKGNAGFSFVGQVSEDGKSAVFPAAWAIKSF